MKILKHETFCMFDLELVMVAGDFGPTSSVSIRDTIWIYLISKTIENRLEEKLFFSFFFACARRKKVTFLFWKNLFLCKQILFLSCRHFVCVQGQNKSCFFTIETFFYERCFLILMLGVYFLTIFYIMIKQLIFL